MTDVPDSFGKMVVQQMFDLWITPHVASGAAEVSADQVQQALIVMPPGDKPEVLLNERATLTTVVKTRRNIAEGEQVPLDDIE